MSPSFLSFYLLLTAFIGGAVVMIIEILGTRIIGPFFGVSLFVWTSLITVTLLALAAGYFAGGALADKKPHPVFLYSLILLAGLSLLLIPLLKNWVLKNVTAWGVRWGSLVGAFILFFLPLFFLGMIAPYLVKLYTREADKIGRTAGRLYAVSTVGSVMGTLVTGFYLIPHFSLNEILFLVGWGLILLSGGFWVFKFFLQT